MKRVVNSGIGWPLVFVGAVGTGKTCAALCLADAAFSSIYYTVADLNAELRRAMDGKNGPDDGHGWRPTEWSIWECWKKADLAILDEIGVREKATDWQYEIVKRCIDTREGRPALFISNLELQDIAERYDDRISSRLAGGTVIKFAGQDLRLQHLADCEIPF